MTISTTERQSVGERARQAGFARVLHAEWTKFRTVRRWLISVIVAALVTVLLGLLASLATHGHCLPAPGEVCGGPPMGPDGEQVSDSYYFVYQPLTGNGSITVRVTSMTGLITYPEAHPDTAIVPGVEPWAKAGVLIEPSTRQGTAYAAVMATGSHGVRMQYNYAHDVAGLPGNASAASPRWLRLTRSGDMLTGYESVDGQHWAEISAVRLPGLPTTVQAGLFVTSPEDSFVPPGVFSGGTSHLTNVTGAFDHLSLQGDAHGPLIRADVGQLPGGPPLAQGKFAESGGRLTLTGTGDIAPTVFGRPVEGTLRGEFAGLIVVIVVGAMFVTAEYRRGLIRTTLAASPRRGRVLLAKAIVIGSVSFVAGLVGAAAAMPLGEHLMRSNDVRLYPVSMLSELRVIAVTGALFAVTAILALGVGAVARRSAGAVASVIAGMVLPYLLAISNVMPVGAAEWLLRLTPAAGLAIQQTLPEYPQVNSVYSAGSGYFPLSPWAGFAVLCGYAAAALILATFLLRRRDA
jgi:ABC-type transport system involved in multi-copper enzyme maturation permease subunit